MVDLLTGLNRIFAFFVGEVRQRPPDTGRFEAEDDAVTFRHRSAVEAVLFEGTKGFAAASAFEIIRVSSGEHLNFVVERRFRQQEVRRGGSLDRGHDSRILDDEGPVGDRESVSLGDERASEATGTGRAPKRVEIVSKEITVLVAELEVTVGLAATGGGPLVGSEKSSVDRSVKISVQFHDVGVPDRLSRVGKSIPTDQQVRASVGVAGRVPDINGVTRDTGVRRTGERTAEFVAIRRTGPIRQIGGDGGGPSGVVRRRGVTHRESRCRTSGRDSEQDEEDGDDSQSNPDGSGPSRAKGKDSVGTFCGGFTAVCGRR
ncbi:hypothetical protein J2744_001054 [Halorubrum trapanicum]|uniref:Uncharacterized protein n=1 Tax=Halorubrum trapanicum TaxID=29284 RepID=A0A8J7ULS6_9EURY|nr:hypothetical protein [Halorubrum trapanicum]MBP1901384.1 hypothetical protein [Halorubrum trapanicum]